MLKIGLLFKIMSVFIFFDLIEFVKEFNVLFVIEFGVNGLLI